MDIPVGKRVEAWREYSGLTKRGLAAEIGVSRQAIDQIEANHQARIQTIEAIAKAVGVSMSRFFGPLPGRKAS